jgi:quinol monooxygenase YgiN
MSFVLIVRMRAGDGSEERAAEIVAELAEETRKEPGCELYIPCRDPEDPRSFVIYEQYVSKAGWEAHGETEHFRRLGPGELFGLMESRERSFFETVA